jgi:hypothetical protein
MTRFAGWSHDMRVVDPHERRLEPGRLVVLPFKKSSERCKLHTFLLMGAVGKTSGILKDAWYG